ncbi:hypothetical protein [Cellulomonas sp. NTE-D12]|uniref:hypothetical protein n=1 Tax=Cellulomonas sp. NTE-D12 TaxID=2962632 RepID=UPI00308144AA
MYDDRLRFTATKWQYEEFIRLLDEPLPSTARLEELWSRASPFGSWFPLHAPDSVAIRQERDKPQRT